MVFRLLPAAVFALATSAIAGCAVEGADSDVVGDVASDLVATSTYECSEQEGKRSVGATVSFKGGTLTSATLTKIPYKGFAARHELRGTAGKVSTGSNSAEKYTHVT